MPRIPINFENCVIYKIVCNDLNVKELYVGSTTDFPKRKSQHKKSCNNENDKGFNFKLNEMIRQHGGWDNWTMLEIEKYSCVDSNEARTRQRYWLEKLNAELNMINPIRTKEDDRKSAKIYRENHKDVVQRRKLKYYEKNKDKIQEQNSEKHKCVCGGVYTTHHKAEHMRYKKHIKYLENLLLEPVQNTV